MCKGKNNEPRRRRGYTAPKNSEIMQTFCKKLAGKLVKQSLYNCSGDQTDALPDSSRIASCFAIITSREVIVAGVLNVKMAASRFVNVSGEVINVWREADM